MHFLLKKLWIKHWKIPHVVQKCHNICYFLYGLFLCSKAAKHIGSTYLPIQTYSHLYLVNITIMSSIRDLSGLIHVVEHSIKRRYPFLYHWEHDHAWTWILWIPELMWRICNCWLNCLWLIDIVLIIESIYFWLSIFHYLHWCQRILGLNRLNGLNIHIYTFEKTVSKTDFEWKILYTAHIFCKIYCISKYNSSQHCDLLLCDNSFYIPMTRVKLRHTLTDILLSSSFQSRDVYKELKFINQRFPTK